MVPVHYGCCSAHKHFYRSSGDRWPGRSAVKLWYGLRDYMFASFLSSFHCSHIVAIQALHIRTYHIDNGAKEDAAQHLLRAECEHTFCIPLNGSISQISRWSLIHLLMVTGTGVDFGRNSLFLGCFLINEGQQTRINSQQDSWSLNNNTLNVWQIITDGYMYHRLGLCNRWKRCRMLRIPVLLRWTGEELN